MNSCNTRINDYNWHRINAARLRGEAIGNAVAALFGWLAGVWHRASVRLGGAVEAQGKTPASR